MSLLLARLGGSATYRPEYLIPLLLLGLIAATLQPLYTLALLAGVTVAVLVIARPWAGLPLAALSVPLGSLVESRTGNLPVGPTDILVLLTAASFFARLLSRDSGRIVRRLQTGPLFWPMALFLIVALFSASFAQSVPSALREMLRWVELLLAYLLALNLLRSDDESDGTAFVAAPIGPGLPRDGGFCLKVTIGAILLGGIIEGLLGLAQFLFHLGPASFGVGRFLRAYGTFGQPNPYAGYLGMIVPLALALFLIWPKARLWIGRNRALLATEPLVLLVGVGLAVSLLGMILSLSRGAWMGLALAILIVVSFWSKKLSGWALAVVLIGATILIVGSADVLPDFISARLQPVIGYFRIFDARSVIPNADNWAIVERMAHWQAGWDMLVDYPLTGVGPGNYPVAYPDYAILPYWKDPLGHAHNIYLNVAGEMGIFGLTTFLVMFASWLILALRVARSKIASEEVFPLFYRAIGVGVLGLLAAVAVHSLFDNLFVHGMNVQVGLTLGILAEASRKISRFGATIASTSGRV